MADEDEIDILGDFSFDSCLAQNDRGIPSCSDREDTVHPQWLLDSMTNWYDIQSKDVNRAKEGPSRKLSGNSSMEKYNKVVHTMWTPNERLLLMREMKKHGRNVQKISKSLKTKTEAEIQALIEAEHGVQLDSTPVGVGGDGEHIPSVVQEEVVTDDMSGVGNVITMVTTGSTTVSVPKTHPLSRKNKSNNHSLLRPDALLNKSPNLIAVNPAEILYEDDLVIGSTESIGNETDAIEVLTKNMIKNHKERVKAVKKIGNHRRKVSRNYDKKPRNSSKDFVKSPLGRQRKDSSVSEDSTKSPKLQIVLGSGVTLPVSEGEQVIKIEKKNDSEQESDIEIDIDSDTDDNTRNNNVKPPEKKPPDESVKTEEPIAVPLRKFEPLPRRQRKINLDGGGGYTIMHTAAGDLYAVGAEPRRERVPRRQPVQLLHCRIYNAERPAPFNVYLHVSTLISMDVHAHGSSAEVMGLLGGVAGGAGGRDVTLCAYRRVRAAATATHCDMDPVSQASAGSSLRAAGLSVVGWHHSHPTFPPAPSARDLSSQSALQRATPANHPFLAAITSQHWPTGRTASSYKCFRIEDVDDESEVPVGYQFSVRLVPDLVLDTAEGEDEGAGGAEGAGAAEGTGGTEGAGVSCSTLSLSRYVRELRAALQEAAPPALALHMTRDVCPQAQMTYLEKCLSSVRHHVRAAGYEDGGLLARDLERALRDILR